MSSIIRRPLQKATKAYLLGVLHDATKRKTTFRIAQKSKIYIESLADGIRSLGVSAWTYREGINRKVYIVEFSKALLTRVKIRSRQEKIDYIRGYFDAEGGIARDPKDFVQIIGSWHPDKSRFLRVKR